MRPGQCNTGGRWHWRRGRLTMRQRTAGLGRAHLTIPHLIRSPLFALPPGGDWLVVAHRAAASVAQRCGASAMCKRNYFPELERARCRTSGLASPPRLRQPRCCCAARGCNAPIAPLATITQPSGEVGSITVLAYGNQGGGQPGERTGSLCSQVETSCAQARQGRTGQGLGRAEQLAACVPCAGM